MAQRRNSFLKLLCPVLLAALAAGLWNVRKVEQVALAEGAPNSGQSSSESEYPATTTGSWDSVDSAGESLQKLDSDAFLALYPWGRTQENSVTFKVVEEAYQQEFPFVVQLRRKSAEIHICTAALIGPWTVLALASCVSKDKGKVWAEPLPDVVGGSGSLRDQDVTLHASTVRQHIHPEFAGNQEDGFVHDLAILKLSKPMCAHKYLSLESPPCGTWRYFGWFRASKYGAPSARLQVVPEVDSVSAEKCKEEFHPKVVPQNTLCAVRRNRMGTICEWDAGSVLIATCPVDGGHLHHFLVGLASHRKAEMCTTAPYVYPDIAKYRDWIQGFIDNTTCEVVDAMVK